MFLAAFTSACSECREHEVHRKTAWLSRDFGSTCPHTEHRNEVKAAGTLITSVPVYRATDVNACSNRYHPFPRMARFKPDLLARQQCIDMLCGYLRLPFDPDSGDNHLTEFVSTTTWSATPPATHIEEQRRQAIESG
jgi:hypothetical protein